MAQKPTPAKERFWKYVDKASDPRGCWLWTGATSDGYGNFFYGTRAVKAHRASWEINRSPIPEGLWVLHTCDNPLCVNPLHLFLGTNELNVIDMVSKGRARSGAHMYPEKCARGSKHGRAKLDEETVREIRRLHGEGTRVTELAKRYRISHSVISGIINRGIWKHV